MKEMISMSLGWDMQMQRKLNEGRIEGTHLANYKDVESIKKNQRFSLKKSIENCGSLNRKL